MTDNKSLFCIGYGMTAARLSARLMDEGWRVAGTTRGIEKSREMAGAGVMARLWDGDGNALPGTWLDGAGAVIVSTPPTDDGCPALAAAQDALAEHANNLQWIAYLSSNGVYGDHGGAVVTEETPPAPKSQTGKRRLAAEKAWRAFADDHGLPLVVFRLPGIYGPGRSILDTVRAGKATRIDLPGHFVNRAHVDDIAAMLAASLHARRAGEEEHDLYNIADDEPAATADVVAFACDLLGVEAPPLVALDDAGLSPRARSFYDECKRVSNERIKTSLGVKLKFPSYRQGLREIFERES